MKIHGYLLAGAIAIAVMSATAAFAATAGPPTHDPGFGLSHFLKSDPMLSIGNAGTVVTLTKDYQVVDVGFLFNMPDEPEGDGGGNDSGGEQAPTPPAEPPADEGFLLHFHSIGGAAFKV